MSLIESKALAVVADLGVADRLAEGTARADQLAAACGADADALGRVLRFLAGRGIFRLRRDGTFANNRASDLLRDDHPASLRSWARFFGSDWHVAMWNELGHSVRTGGAGAEAAFGASFWEVLTDVHPEAGAVFDQAMESMSRLQTAVIPRKHDFSRCARVCDVGGGTGTLLAGILAANPGVRGVLFDLPSVVAKAGPVLARAGVADRVDVVGGDFFESVPEGCDRYILQAIVHDWDDDSCTRFLSSCRAALAPSGRVLVLEQVVPEHRGDHPAKAIDLEMLVDTGRGRERTREEFDALFARSGLRVERATPIAITTLFELVPRQAP
jgi:O-methyltransferase domain